MAEDRVVVVGAGVGGMAAAIDLAAQGLAVTLVERAEQPGGKIRHLQVAGRAVDAGPTVLTMRHVFEALFAAAGQSLGAYLTLERAGTLARHVWPDGSVLDLESDLETSMDAVGRFAGRGEAQRFRAFSERAAAVHDTLERSFIHATRPNPLSLPARVGLSRLGALTRIAPFTTLWDSLGRQFRDPRLRQLFARYATYCGSSPLQAPATLMLVAHVERQGVWLVQGGMHRLAQAMAQLAADLGVELRLGTEVLRITTRNGRADGVRLADDSLLHADAVVVNADAAAVAAGLLGPEVTAATQPVPRTERSLSAMTWALVAPTRGLELAHHNVFFNRRYPDEFHDLFRHRRPPLDPTVYVCAQDRGARPGPAPGATERLLCIVNAPADGDVAPLTAAEIEACASSTFQALARCGLHVDHNSADLALTTPTDFHRLFPGTGGALYGRASHGWAASFRRPGAKTRIPGLYLAGGSTHPGPGVPMATLSGRLAAQQTLADLTSARRSSTVAISGGTWTR